MTARYLLIAFVWCPAVLSSLGTGAAAAQRGNRPWSPNARVTGEVHYDDNLFLLTAGRKRRLDQVSFADSQSGRFRGMEAATDLVPVSTLELGVEGPGIGGRRLEFAGEVSYEANLQNAERRHAEFGFTAQQSLRRDGRVRLKAAWRPRYFHKNYLRDAVDLNGDGDIGPAERRYDAGMSREFDVSVGYRHRLLRSTRARPVGLTAELEVGYFDRGYEAPFAARGRRGPGGALAFVFALGRRWTLDVDLALESLTGNPAREVLILDENAFGNAQDFNLNGAFDDDSARAFELVDRSRTEQELGVALEGELSRAVTLELAYGHRVRRFTSEQPFDVSNRGRRDRRHEFEAGLDLRLVSGLHLRLAGRRVAQNTNRSGDPGSTGEVTDYTRHVASAGLRLRF